MITLRYHTKLPRYSPVSCSLVQFPDARGELSLYRARIEGRAGSSGAKVFNYDEMLRFQWLKNLANVSLKHDDVLLRMLCADIIKKSPFPSPSPSPSSSSLCADIIKKSYALTRCSEHPAHGPIGQVWGDNV